MRCQRQKAAPSRNECLTSCRVFKCKLQQSTTFVWNQSQQRDMLYILPCSTYAHWPSIVFLFFISNMSSPSLTHPHGSDPLLHLDKHIQLSDPQPQSHIHMHATTTMLGRRSPISLRLSPLSPFGWRYHSLALTTCSFVRGLD